MRKTVISLVLITFICTGVGTVSAFTVFDPINHATSLLRNAILEAQQIEDLLEAGKRLLELKNLLKEFQFFNQKLIEAGFGEIENVIQKFRSFFGGSPGGSLFPFGEETSKTYLQTVQQNPFFQGTASQVAQIEFASAGAESGATTLPYYLTLVPDPLSPNHPYITYEQGQIARTFDESEALRKYARELAKDGADLEEAAAQANLLGATRLQAASMGKLYEAFGVLLSAQGRLAELNAISLEQTSRDEKLDELARRKMFQDMGEFVYGSQAPVIEGGGL